jgi:predicted transcriptional regulator
MRCYHPTDLGRSCGFCLNCQTMADIRAYDDARDADLMSELAQGTKELGARATLCPIMLATIGLEWDAVQAVARSMAGAWRVNPTARAILEAVQRSGTGRPGSVEEC